jgi:hypothetical protein
MLLICIAVVILFQVWNKDRNLRTASPNSSLISYLMTIACNLAKKEFNIPYDLISMKGISEIRLDFSLKSEVFYIVIGSVVGAIFMILAKMILDPQTGIPYDITWIAFGHIRSFLAPFICNPCRNYNSSDYCSLNRHCDRCIPLQN